MKKISAVVLPAFVLLLAACLPSQEQIDQVVSSVEQTALAQVTVIAPTANVDAIVQATFQALTAQAPTATAVPTGGTDAIPTNTPPGGQSGSLAGTLSYPAEGIPAMALVAYHVGGGQNDYYYVVTNPGQSTYQIDNLPAGNYHVVAYTMGGGGFPAGLPGGYTQFVLCGMQPACADHALVDASVNAGQITADVNPQDWYAPDGSFPAYPLP